MALKDRGKSGTIEESTDNTRENSPNPVFSDFDDEGEDDDDDNDDENKTQLSQNSIPSQTNVDEKVSAMMKELHSGGLMDDMDADEYDIWGDDNDDDEENEEEEEGGMV